MSISLYNHLGQISLTDIDPATVAALDDAQKSALLILIDKFKARQLATERYHAAIKAERAATTEQAAALEEHVKRNPPQTFAEARASAIAAFNKSH
jgi:hypothetical protein